MCHVLVVFQSGPRTAELAWNIALIFHGIGHLWLSQALDCTRVFNCERRVRKEKERRRDEWVRQRGSRKLRKIRRMTNVLPQPSGRKKIRNTQTKGQRKLVLNLLPKIFGNLNFHLQGMKIESYKYKVNCGSYEKSLGLNQKTIQNFPTTINHLKHRTIHGQFLVSFKSSCHQIHAVFLFWRINVKKI